MVAYYHSGTIPRKCAKSLNNQFLILKILTLCFVGSLFNHFSFQGTSWSMGPAFHWIQCYFQWGSFLSKSLVQPKICITPDQEILRRFWNCSHGWGLYDYIIKLHSTWTSSYKRRLSIESNDAFLINFCDEFICLCRDMYAKSEIKKLLQWIWKCFGAMVPGSRRSGIW